MKTRICLVAGALCLALLVGVVTSVFAGGTEVTMTKTSSRFASTSMYDGTYYRYAYIQELDVGYNLTYFVYMLSPHTVIEYGSGPIARSDASIDAMTATLDVDTTGIAQVGAGGRLTLLWTGNELTASESSGKSTYRALGTKSISFVGYSQASATVDGSFLGAGYTGTGGITTNMGKVIVQTKAK